MLHSVKDVLPDDGQRVLCLEDFRIIGKTWVGWDVFYYRKGIGFVNLQDDDDPYGLITHWTELPDIPEYDFMRYADDKYVGEGE